VGQSRSGTGDRASALHLTVRPGAPAIVARAYRGVNECGYQSESEPVADNSTGSLSAFAAREGVLTALLFSTLG